MIASGANRDQGGAGPFTPSRIKGLPQSGAALPAHSVEGGLLARAHVTAPHIPEGRALYPRAVPAMPPAPRAADDPAPVLPVEDRALAQHPVPRRNDLRLLPLEGFVWGARSTPPLPRTRPDHVLIWVTAGGLQLDFPRRRMILNPGTVQFLPAGTAFATLPLGPARGHVLLVGTGLCRGISPPLPAQPVLGSIGDGAAALSVTLSDLAQESARNARDSAAAIACHLGLLAVRLARLGTPPPRPPAPMQVAPNLPLVNSFLKLAGDRLGKGDTVGDLAESLGVSATTLDRACLRARGRRAIDLIHDLRHETAVDLLRDTTRPLAGIARELGYTSIAHFTRAFVARTGRLPQSFRDP